MSHRPRWRLLPRPRNRPNDRRRIDAIPQQSMEIDIKADSDHCITPFFGGTLRQTEIRGKSNIMKPIRIAALASVGFAVLADTALAGGPSGVPGPIAGVGLPALILIGGAYWLGRKFFSRKV